MTGLEPWTLLLAFGAGALSTLSPCVLPLLPVVAAAALARHHLGPLALAAGLAAAFTAAGLFVAGAGLALGIDGPALRRLGAVGLLAAGAVLLSSRLQAGFAQQLAGLESAGDRWALRWHGAGLVPQFALGALLGLIWTPCAGPTLGATFAALAADDPAWTAIAPTMAVYGLGAGSPLLAAGWGAARLGTRWRERLQHLVQHGRRALGGVLALLGLAVLTGADKRLEAWMLARLPAWAAAVGVAL